MSSVNTYERLLALLDQHNVSRPSLDAIGLTAGFMSGTQ